MDIVLEEDGQRTGFLAETVEEYAEAILDIVKMKETERLKMAAYARKWATRFSEQQFSEDIDLLSFLILLDWLKSFVIIRP